MSVCQEDTPIVNLCDLVASKNKKRMDEVQTVFTKTYGSKPAFLVKVPGR